MKRAFLLGLLATFAGWVLQCSSDKAVVDALLRDIGVRDVSRVSESTVPDRGWDSTKIDGIGPKADGAGADLTKTIYKGTFATPLPCKTKWITDPPAVTLWSDYTYAPSFGSGMTPWLILDQTTGCLSVHPTYKVPTSAAYRLVVID